MNHYPHHIGDFVKDTMGFSQGAIGAYRLLMDAYYANEEAPAEEEVYVIGRATTPAERKAVDKALTRFDLRDGRYYHKRVEEELALYRARAEHNREVGKLGGRPKKPGRNPEGNPDGTRKLSHKEPEKNPEGNPNRNPDHNPEETLASSHKPGKPQTPGEKRFPEVPTSGPAASAGALSPHPIAGPPRKPTDLLELCRRDRVSDPSSLYARQWAAEGITDAIWKAAIAIARQPGRKPDPELIPATYLAPIIADLVLGRIKPVEPTGLEARARAKELIAAEEARHAAP